jgi:hypothetical protein
VTVENYSRKARELVLDVVNADAYTSVPIELGDVFLVWFCKTLQNWKALVATTQGIPTYYEVTHNGDTGETYIDVYSKSYQVIATPVPGKSVS